MKGPKFHPGKHIKSLWLCSIAIVLVGACSTQSIHVASTTAAATDIISTLTMGTNGVDETEAAPTIGPVPSDTRAPRPSSTRGLASTPFDTPVPTHAIPAATRSAEATVAALGTICEKPATDYRATLSLDGHWVAMACRGTDGVIDSHLRIISLDGRSDWSIHFADYANGEAFDRNNMVHAFHWSRDGKYLYAASPSKASGCCWIGDYALLVRLDLATGQQTEVVNFARIPPGADFSFSPSDRYFVYIPQDGTNRLFILDLLTWSTRAIVLEFENTGAGYTLMSNNDEKIILILRQYLPQSQGDVTLGSFVVIDLLSGLQR